MKVLKRSGILEDLDIKKTQKNTFEATKDLQGVSQSELEVDAGLRFRDGMKTEEIQQALIQTAVDKIDIDRPNWSFVAARLFLFDLYHVVGRNIGGEKGRRYPKFSKYINKSIEEGRITPSLKSLYNLDDVEKYIQPDRDFQFNYLGIKTLYGRYLLKDKNGTPIELPQYMFMGIAMFLAQREDDISCLSEDEIQGYKFRFGIDKWEEEAKKDIRLRWAVKFYDMISKFEVMLATPTLSNARTPKHQLSSCYVGSSPDNIEGIFDSYKEKALLSKFGGGIGWDWTNIRGIGSSIDSHKGAAGGIVPFLKIDNDVAIAVDQLGTRKGAIAVYLQPWHIDIEDFLDLKKNSGEERRRAHDLFPAIWLNSFFMERVQNNEVWSLFDPYEVPELSTLYGEDFKKTYIEAELNPSIRKSQVKARDLWKKIITSYFETGTPFLCHADEANRRNPNRHKGIIRSSNLCTEIFQNTKPNTYLIRFEFEDGTFLLKDENDIMVLKDGSKKQAKKISTLDILSTKETDGAEKTIFFIDKEAIEGETAVCNLASINLSKVNTKEDLERVVPIAMRMLDNVIDLNFYPVRKTKTTNMATRAVGLGIMGEAQMLAEQKIKWGSNEHFEKIDEIMEIFSFNAIKASSDLAKERGAYPNFPGSDWSKGIMPIDTANKEAKNLTKRDTSCDWDWLREKVKKDGVRNGYMMSIAPTSSISILTGTTQAIEPVYRKKWFEENISGLIPVVAPNLSADTWEYYTGAYDVNQLDLIKAGAVRQKWIDQGQSLNVFVRQDVKASVLNKIYFLAWKLGLKSNYYLRSESPELKNDAPLDRSFECTSCQ